MISIETMKFRTADMIGEEFPLVFWRGKGRIVASDDTSLSLLVRGHARRPHLGPAHRHLERAPLQPHAHRGRARRRRRRRRRRQPLRLPAGRRRVGARHRRPAGAQGAPRARRCTSTPTCRGPRRGPRGGARSTATDAAARRGRRVRRDPSRQGPARLRLLRRRRAGGARAAPAQRVRLETADCFDDQVRAPGDALDAVDWDADQPGHRAGLRRGRRARRRPRACSSSASRSARRA